MRRLLPLLPLALFLSACDQQGYPNTDTEAIMLGGVIALIVICITIIIVSWIRSDRE